MAGLLDWYQDPATQQQLGLVAGLLSAGGPSRQPTSIGQGLSQGLLMGSNLANDARRGQLMGLQGETMRTGLDAQKRAQAAIEALAQQIPPEDRARFLADPTGYLKAINDPYTLKPGDRRMQGTKEIASSAPNLHFQDFGSGVAGLNPQTGQPMTTMLPKGMTPDAAGNLGQRQYEFNNVSAADKGRLGIDFSRLGLDREKFGFDKQNTSANTWANTGVALSGFTPPQVPQGFVPPKIQFDINAAAPKAAAQARGEAEGKKEVNMAGITETLGEAEKLLKTKGWDSPTGSIIGTGIDYSMSGTGISTTSAENAEKLRVIGANLVMKMPRMEGPQSDKDTQAYREAAGRVGDSTIPIGRRIAALEEVKKLYSKYDKAAGPRVVDW